jgi:hypothetical protein
MVQSYVGKTMWLERIFRYKENLLDTCREVYKTEKNPIIKEAVKTFALKVKAHTPVQQ